MVKLLCLSNELTHSDSSFRGRPKIIQAGPEQYVSDPDSGNAIRKYRNSCDGQTVLGNPQRSPRCPKKTSRVQRVVEHWDKFLQQIAAHIDPEVSATDKIRFGKRRLATFVFVGSIWFFVDKIGV